MAIVLLVSFGTEHRVLSATQNEVITKVRDLFHIPQEYEIKLQRYSQDWGEWLTIDQSEIKNRDKVRVQSCIMDLTNIATCSTLTSDPVPACSSIFSSVMEDSLENDPFSSLESEIEPVATTNQTSPFTTSAEESEPPTTRAKTATGRVKLELKSWPVDVKIPCENMSPQLRSTLDQGIFPTTKQRRQLIQVLYDYMLQFGRYPSRFHYEQVAQQLIKEYPCLAQNNIPSAKPYDYWKLKISDKFRNERKSMGNLVDEERRRKVRKVSHQPELEGEDHGSIMMHIKWMQDESTKKTPDWKKVKALMEITFHERRGDITNKMMVQDIKEKYPFLFSITEIHNEFERINGVAGVTTITKNLRPFVEGILHFPYKDKHAENFIKTTFANKLTEAVTMEKAEEIKIIAALSLLPSLFKKNPSSIMGTKDEHSNENLAPFLLVSSKNIFEADGFVVNCEQVEVCSCKTFMEGLALLVESFWVFDMQYPKATKDIYNFMECCLFKLKAVKPSRCVYSVLTKLSFPDST
ncbi:sterile alpha motif domain-containing protein 3-like isoform X2 [Apostichopus japonicus]|uniref:sterile alpha motif domain-containing protein 3-like isoform X2 n=1 Tax=Stichopus japonicus TaxID=307972 RepID=UPI003AB83A6E